MRLPACAAVLAVAAAICASAASPSTPGSGTRLQIVVWPQGKGRPAKSWALECGPTGGSLPTAPRACRVLASLRRPFRPVPPDAVCTEVYGGPALAVVRGSFKGKPIRASFNRVDGCQIARWDRLRWLFGPI